jgi:chitodextrinase
MSSLDQKFCAVLEPVTITDAMLTSSTVPEPDAGEVAWNAINAYLKGDRVYLAAKHMHYERLIAGTTAGSPDVDTVNWAEVEPTNQRGMFDKAIGTATTATNSLTVVLRPGAVGGVSLLELSNCTDCTVLMKDGPGGTQAYFADVNLDSSIVESVYEWFFGEVELRTDFALTDLPMHFGDPEVTITLTGSGTIACGALLIGAVTFIGAAQFGARLRLIDYSKKTTDEWGRTTITQRAFSKRMDLVVECNATERNRIFRLLTRNRATYALYIASIAASYETLMVYGWPNDWDIALPLPTRDYLTIELEGLT